MSTVTARTKAKMLVSEGLPTVGAALSGNNLILTRQNGSTITALNVKGPQGLTGIGNLIYERGTWTPNWLSTLPGSGGSVLNEGTYQWLGGPNVNDYGHMNIGVQMRFGTTSPTLPSGAVTRVIMPPGFAFGNNSGISTFNRLGRALLVPQGVIANARHALVTRSSINQMTVKLLGTSGVPSDPAATTPFTWAAGDSIIVHVTGLLARRI